MPPSDDLPIGGVPRGCRSVAVGACGLTCLVRKSTRDVGLCSSSHGACRSMASVLIADIASATAPQRIRCVADQLADPSFREGSAPSVWRFRMGSRPIAGVAWCGGRHPSELTVDEFISLHRTGSIPAGAYEGYRVGEVIATKRPFPSRAVTGCRRGRRLISPQRADGGGLSECRRRLLSPARVRALRQASSIPARCEHQRTPEK